MESTTASNRAYLQKKKSALIRGTIYHIHKVKQNTTSISPSMCFSASASIDGSTVNGLVLPVEAFTVHFDHFFHILFLQREANYKCDNTDNNENVTKYVKNSPVKLLPPECTTYRGLKGHFPYDPSSTLSYEAAIGQFHTLVGTS
jgi:hypothetical protein